MTVWVRQQLAFLHYSKTLLIAFALLAATSAVLLMSRPADAAPSTDRVINFSARLKNADGSVAPDGFYNVSFRLYTRGESGSPIWSETYYDENGPVAGQDYRVQVKGGYLSAKLGSRVAFNDTVNWDDNLWLTMNIGGMTQIGAPASIPWDGEMSPRIQLTAVPYALNAGSLGGKKAGDFIQLGQGVQTNSSDNPSIQINSTGSGELVQLQRNAEDVFTIDADGNIAFGSGADHTISIAQSDANTDGKTLVISGGDGGSGDTDGGNLVLSGGNGSGSGSDGLVVLTTTAFATAMNDVNCYANGAPVPASCTVSQSTVDTSSAAMIGFSKAGQTATLPDPTLATPGRILYVMAASDSLTFTLAVNNGATLTMTPSSAQTLLWNGTDWVQANGQSLEPPIEDQKVPENVVIDEQDEAPAPVIDVAETPEPDTTSTDNAADDAPANPSPSILRLDNLESAPATKEEGALPGSMYYDVALGKVQCYEANGWGNCGDAPDTFVAISPEYKNAVMNGTDIGVISSDFCSGSLGINDGSDEQQAVCDTDETYNFYRWTSEEETDQTRSIYLTYQLPDNFKSFVAGSTSIMGRNDSTDANVNYQIYRDNGSGLIACGGPIAVTSATAAWQQGLASGESDPSKCDFEAGDSILFRINLTSKKSANAYVSNVNFIFRNS